MRIPVMTAVGDATAESALVERLSAGGSGLTLVRRCVDLADLLAAAATGCARAAVIGADLRRLDRDALARLDRYGVQVVVLIPPDDEATERRIRQLGVARPLPNDAPAARIAAAVTELVDGAEPAQPSPHQVDHPVLPLGQLVAIWGPAGAPGRTTVAVTLAAELALLGAPTILIDADPYGGSVAQHLGLLDEVSGLAAAVRAANGGALDILRLAGLLLDVGPDAGQLRVLTGLARPQRWPELRAAGLEAVFDLARASSPLTIVDCGFCLEQDDGWQPDIAAPQRNAATLSTLRVADRIVVVGAPDPVGLVRLARGLPDLQDVRPGLSDTELLIVINRVRDASSASLAELRDVIRRHCGISPVAMVPLDVDGACTALACGRALSEVAPRSPARSELAALAATLLGRQAPARRRWRGGRNRTGRHVAGRGAGEPGMSSSAVNPGG